MWPRSLALAAAAAAATLAHASPRLRASDSPASAGAAAAAVARHLDGASPLITYPTLADVIARLHALEAAAPDLVEIWSAQERYGVASPGDCSGVPCEHWFVSITNRTSGGADAATQSPSLRDRPQVFLSGNLHGDEWVGPVTLITLAELLVAGADATAPTFNPWLASLVNTRTVVMLVVSNPWGFVRKSRKDANDIDPNFDFPFALGEDGACMVSSVARAINADFRAHAYQLALSFHGGEHSISHVWGAGDHADAPTPDEAAHTALAVTMRDVAGALNDLEYKVGRISDVSSEAGNGGMEDWAYGGASCLLLVAAAHLTFQERVGGA